MPLRRFAPPGRLASLVHASLRVARAGCAWLIALTIASPLFAQTSDAPSLRLRVYWSGPAAVWSGSASVSEGRLADAQPLSGAADATALAMLKGDRVRIAPRRPVARGAFDVTALAQRSATFHVELRGEGSAPITIDVPLSQLAQQPHSVPLDEEGGVLQVYRLPDDRLRVRSARKQFIFTPGEAFPFTVDAALPGVEPFTPITLHAELIRGRSGAVVWASEPQQVEVPTAGPATAEFAPEAPDEEGVYTFRIAAHPRSGMLQEWVKATPKPLAERTFQIVVWDAQRVTRADGTEQLLHEIDPATPRWWERIPGWRWPRRVWRSEGPLGSGPAGVAETPLGRFVRLGAREEGGAPQWQAYPLSVRNAGAPHVVEIETPADAPQELDLALLDSDARGHASSLGDGLTAAVERWSSKDGDRRTVRKLFWPKTTSPLLVLSNHSTKYEAMYGKVRVYELQRAASPAAEPTAEERLVTTCVTSAYLPHVMHASRQRAREADYLYEDWQTFYETATRLADYVELAGYNGAVVKVAAAPGAAYPTDVLGAQPGLDWGVFASGARDVPRKDLLELLLREFDRRGLRLVPALELESVLPGVEAQRGEAPGAIDCVDAAGARPPGAPVRYNPLAPSVRAGMVNAVAELAARCAGHASYAGVALDLSADSYATLPGDKWGADPATVDRFFAQSQLQWPGDMPRSAANVESALLGPLNTKWRDWRSAQMAALYGEMARHVRQGSAEAQLLLLADRLLDDAQGRAMTRPDLQKKPSLERALAARGLDPEQLATPPGLTFVWPREVSPPSELPSAAAPLAKNELYWGAEDAPRRGAVLLSSTRKSLTLPSLAARSPFGAESTDPSFVLAKRLTARAVARDLAWVADEAPRAHLLDGGHAAPLLLDEQRSAALRLLRQAPVDATYQRAQAHQPLTVGGFQTEDAAFVAVANQSAWPITTTITLNAPVACEATRIDDGAGGESLPSRLDAGAHAKELQLPAYGLAALRFDKPGVTVSGVRRQPQPEAAAELRAAVQSLQNRDLSAPAVLPGPGNLSFDQSGPDGRPVGWEAPENASVALTDQNPVNGSGALAISAGAAPVVVTSRPFAAPRTGQFVMMLHVRGDRISPQSRLTIRLRDPGGEYDRRRVVDTSLLTPSDQWQWFALSEQLPLEAGLQMQVALEVTSATVSIDNIQMHALDFPLDSLDIRKSKLDRLALLRFADSAGSALAESRVTDCREILEGYWPRFLTEFTPLVEPQQQAAAKAPPPNAEKEPESPSISRRLRSYLPKIPWF